MQYIQYIINILNIFVYKISKYFGKNTLVRDLAAWSKSNVLALIQRFGSWTTHGEFYLKQSENKPKCSCAKQSVEGCRGTEVHPHATQWATRMFLYAPVTAARCMEPHWWPSEADYKKRTVIVGTARRKYNKRTLQSQEQATCKSKF